MYACNGLLFNHESPRRGETFVTRKITRGLAPDRCRARGLSIYGQSRCLARLGPCPRLRRNAVAHAATAEPEDFVIATGRQESVRRFIELSASALDWGAICWEGKELEEVGRRSDTGHRGAHRPSLFPPGRSGDPARGSQPTPVRNSVGLPPLPLKKW